jgi:hypothetical protein
VKLVQIKVIPFQTFHHFVADVKKSLSGGFESRAKSPENKGNFMSGFTHQLQINVENFRGDSYDK